MNVEAFLIEACKKSDSKAQYTMYAECYNLLMSICVRYMNDRASAKAIMNQGFYKILTNLDKYKEEVPFEAWISRIMVNTIIDDFRKEKKRLSIFESLENLIEKKQFDRIVYNQVEETFLAEDLERMLMQVPKMSRVVFSMYAIDGYKHREIAKELGISENTSKWHLATARKKLQGLLNKEMKPTKYLNYG
jgi:RNA polymerase sigma-70 factor (ECF subfamily)